MRLSRWASAFASSLLLTVCGSLRPSEAYHAGHLYVGVMPRVQAKVLRYPLDAQGRIGPSPDLVYPHVASPIAFGPDGSMYVGCYNCLHQRDSGGTVWVYPPGETRRVRTLNVIRNGASLNALSVNAYGYIVAGGFNFEIYAPGAKVSEPPLDTESTSGPVTGVVFDHGVLLVGEGRGINGNPDAIRASGDIENQPRYLHSLVGTHFRYPRDVGDIAIDSSTELYVLDQPDFEISTYPASAFGTLLPDRVILWRHDPSYSRWPMSLAVRESRLYVAYEEYDWINSNASLNVGVFDARANGSVQPLQVLRVTGEGQIPDGIVYAKVGP